MSRAPATILALLLLAATALPVAAGRPDESGARTGDAPGDPKPPTSPSDGEIIPGEVIVQFRDGKGPEVARSRGLEVLSALGMPGETAAAKGVPSLVSTRGRSVEQVVAELAADPAVEQVEPNYRVQLANEGTVAGVGVNDPKTGDQYSLDRMRVRDAWSLETGASNVIAVLDTGVQFNHPDLAGRLLKGYDFVNDDTNAADDNGHGTWVSGIIAANARDGYGIAGVSWSDKILPVKIMNREGTGSTADLLSAIRWSADHGADVINMSVGGFPYSAIMQEAVNYAFNKGAVLVGAAGNNRREETYYPASFANVISVSATQVNDEFSHWSSYGSKVDVSAPGSSVLTTNCYACTYAGHDGWGSHTYISGTSFATPNVAGVVALIMARYPTYSPQQVVNRLLSTVDDLGYAGWDNRYGLGRVNAYRALGASVSGPGPSHGDSLERNNSLASAPRISVATTTRPTIHPAGDVDWFAVDVPRAGRLNVRVTGVVDTRAYPWNRSSLPVDPIVELYNTAGTRLTRVDNVWESGTELATVTVTGATRIFVRVSNYYVNGNTRTYSVTPTFVDEVAPVASIRQPLAGATDVSRFVDGVITFSEPVTNVTSSTLAIRDMSTYSVVPVSVSYDAGTRTARVSPKARLAASRQYRLEAGGGVTDLSGNSIASKTALFTTGTASFTDTAGTSFEYAIEWLLGAKITGGCTAERFCPTSEVARGAMAAFLARALDAPLTSADYFTDDASSIHQYSINQIADLGVTGGCAPKRYCPTSVVTREQMASFLARALRLPATSRDYFTDDEKSVHEGAINRLAAAGITGGCTATSFCATTSVTREQMAAFLYRGFSGLE